MECKVKYFGRIGEQLNKDSELIEIDSFIKNKQDLKQSFIEQYPQLEGVTFRVAVNGELSNSLPNDLVDIIALLPPFAGG